MIIAFIGWDGTGKSTIRKMLMKRLENKFVLIEGLNFPLMNRIKKIILSINYFNKNNIEEKHREKKEYKSITDIFIANIWYSIVFIYYIYYFIKSKLTNKVLLFDRFVYDYYISLIYLKKNTNFISLLFRLIPKPNLVFFFKANPSTSYNRKKHDHNNEVEYYKEMKELYSEYLERNNIKHHIVNTENMEPNTVYSYIYKKIKNKIA